MFSSASLRYSPPLSRYSFQRLYVAFAANSDQCLFFIRHCADYSEKVVTWCLPFNTSSSPISSREGTPRDLRNRTAGLLSEAVGVSTQNVVATSVKGLSSIPLIPITDRGGNFIFCSPGSRRCKTTYKKALALEQKTVSELNTLLEGLSSWVAVIDGSSDGAPIEGVHPQELGEFGELKCAWEKTRDTIRSALETLTSERVNHHRSPLALAFMHRRFALGRWMTSLVRYS
jgi:hypothetical protein